MQAMVQGQITNAEFDTSSPPRVAAICGPNIRQAGHRSACLEQFGAY
jgi:hypothetical protein